MLGEGLQRLLPGLRCPELELEGSSAGRPALECRVIVMLDGFQGGYELPAKFIPAWVPKEHRQSVHTFRSCRNGVGLLVVNHLDSMLDPAEQPVGCRQLIGDLSGNSAKRGKERQHAQRSLPPEFGDLTAPDQLMRLGQEFDLPNPPLAEFDVLTLDRDPAASLAGIDLSLDRLDVPD